MCPVLGSSLYLGVQGMCVLCYKGCWYWVAVEHVSREQMQGQVRHSGLVLLDPWCVVGICLCTQCVGGVCSLWCIEFVCDKTGTCLVALDLGVRLLVCLCLLHGWSHIFGCIVVLWYVILLCSLAGL